MKYAEVILPFPLDNTFTYCIPNDLEPLVQPLKRVIVPFGKKRYYTALVRNVFEDGSNSDLACKDIISVLDQFPIISSQQIELWEWIASYYLCTLGEVFSAALPSGLLLESQTTIYYNRDFISQSALSSKEQLILDHLSVKGFYSILELEKACGLSNSISSLSALIKQGAINIHEEVKPKYIPKEECYLRLSSSYQCEEDLIPTFAQLKRAKQQERLLLAFMELAQPFKSHEPKEISRKDLLDTTGIKPTVLNALIDKGIFVSYMKPISRLQTPPIELHPFNQLTHEQQEAYENILSTFQTKIVSLLYGPSGCGKTEVFLHLAANYLNKGFHVAYLVPEITDLLHLTNRLNKLFGNSLIVYHSGLNEHERVEVWHKVLHSPIPLIILGVRSSLFLPYQHLGLIIVDDEHEPSYKQQDPAPRYHARNVAIMLAKIFKAKVALGSATPSLDSYFQAKTGKYGLVEIKKCFYDGVKPKIHLVDLKELKRKKIMKGSLFSPILKEKMDRSLSEGKQVIILQNRRGFAPVMECKDCNHVITCMHCEVSLVYHKRIDRMVCHYCSYSIPIPKHCPTCKSTKIELIGFGTERVEEEIITLFPDIKSERLDSDTSRSAKSHEKIIQNFESGKTRILIGTRMVSKVFNHDNVKLVGIMNADILMNIPDFRAHEKTYQLLTQISAQSSKNGKYGEVVIQTSQIKHPIIEQIKNADYEGMAYSQLIERKMFRYPPYYRLIVVVLRSMDEKILEHISDLFADSLKFQLKERVSDAIKPAINKKQRFYTRHIVIRTELSMPVSLVRTVLLDVSSSMKSQIGFNKVRIHFEVDN